MKLLRATIRLSLLVTLMTMQLVPLIAGKLLLRLSPGLELRWRNFNVRRLARLIVYLLKIRIHVINSPPEGSFLLVSNHLSYLDVVVLAAHVDCTFVAKSEVARWPVIGLLAHSVRTLFIDRKRRRDVLQVTRKIEKCIESSLGVVLFAEGTSTAGQSVFPFKSSLLEFAAGKNFPVHYASISYVTCIDEPSPDRAVCWWGDMTFTDHFLGLLQLSSVEATLTFGPQPIVHSDRRVLAEKLWQAVNAQFKAVMVH